MHRFYGVTLLVLFEQASLHAQQIGGRFEYVEVEQGSLGRLCFPVAL